MRWDGGGGAEEGGEGVCAWGVGLGRGMGRTDGLGGGNS